jgi:putative glutamine amidotransferase
MSHGRRLRLLLVPILLLASCERADPQPSGVRIGMTYGTVQAVASLVGWDINDAYRRAVGASGGQIVELSVFDDDEEIAAKLNTLHGILIPGGLDVEPRRYAEAEDEKLELTDGRLDALEFRVLEFARQRSLPVLAICRGHQVLNVFRGGSLYQDIPSQYAEAPRATVHRIMDEGLIYDSPLPCTHDLEIKRDTRLFQLLQESRIEVNSYHHQAIKGLGKGLRVAAVSPDGLPEAIEGSGERFVLGVQFHPEMLFEEVPRFAEIFGAFVAEAMAWGDS